MEFAISDKVMVALEALRLGIPVYLHGKRVIWVNEPTEVDLLSDVKSTVHGLCVKGYYICDREGSSKETLLKYDLNMSEFVLGCNEMSDHEFEEIREKVKQVRELEVSK